jgi:Tfp pilus assembly protein PilF
VPPTATPPSVAAAPSPAKPTKSSESASDLVARARKAWKAGDTATAETLLHRALAAEAGHVGALATLSDLHFDRGAYSKAVDFAERAVARAPRRADLRIALGDALFKVLRYADARKQYAEAKALGSKAADKRVAQVDAKLGTR